MKLYHYTAGANLAAIAKAGELRTYPERPRFPAKGVVWLSTNEEMERSVLDKDWRDPVAYAAKHGGLYRFVASKKLGVALYRWSTLAEIMRLHWRSKQNMEAWAAGVGANPREWIGATESLALDKFRLERYEPGGIWKPVDMDDALREAPELLPLLIEQGPRYRHRHMGAGL